MDALRAQLRRYGVIVVGVLILSLCASIVLSSRLQRFVSAPILRLAHATQAVSGEGNYSVRVEKEGNDELGVLYDGFNEMLAQIQKRDTELEKHHRHLEELVQERTRSLSARTAELTRANAELERANDEVRQFAYIVSHDLRAPLVNLKGFTYELSSALELLGSALEAVLPKLEETQRQTVSALLDEDVPEAVGFIESSVTRMDGFINAVLTLSRLGRRELTFEPVDMNAVVEETLRSLAHQTEERQTTATVGPLPEVVADQTSMEQIMGNLLTNAVLYLDPERPGVIEVTGERGEEQTTFRVRDNGRGIAAEDMPKVFAPFRRAGSQDAPGEGMGLAYVQTLVRRHGGGIGYESTPGVGTTFTFTLSNDPAKGDHRVHASRGDDSSGRGRPGACPPDREEPASLEHHEPNRDGERRPAGARLPVR